MTCDKGTSVFPSIQFSTTAFPDWGHGGLETNSSWRWPVWVWSQCWHMETNNHSTLFTHLHQLTFPQEDYGRKPGHEGAPSWPGVFEQGTFSPWGDSAYSVSSTKSSRNSHMFHVDVVRSIILLAVRPCTNSSRVPKVGIWPTLLMCDSGSPRPHLWAASWPNAVI